MRQKSKGSTDFEIFATGVRNSVGFDFHPITGELFFTENGRGTVFFFFSSLRYLISLLSPPFVAAVM
jgi:hypothetical protein